MKRFRAKCQDHNWEGMSQEQFVEAEKDLKSHIEQFPDESHNGATVIAIELGHKSVLGDHKPGSAQANCDRKGCKFHRGIDRFKIGKNGIRVEIKARPTGVKLDYVNLESLSGGKTIEIDGADASTLNGTSLLVDKGEYKIVPIYTWADTGGKRELILFVSW